MLSDFSTSLSAKWILAGEHAVVRRHPAIVYPLPYYQLALTYEVNDTPWQLSVQGGYQHALNELFFNTLEHALNLAQVKEIERKGNFTINSAIPLGSGLGASSAFCLAISQWLAAQNLINTTDIHQHATQLENLFHGQSSGLDIIGASANSGRFFQHGKDEKIIQTWQPHWYLSFSGTMCKTNECIDQVKAIWQQTPSVAKAIDEQMTKSVHLALSALRQSDHGLSKLTDAINLAKSCFQQWGLINTHLQNHLDELTQAGAVACKPTGSGGGGYVISLWKQPAPELNWPMVPLQLNSVIPNHSTIKEYVQYD